MRRSEFKGTGAVFRYTLQQHYKTVSVRIFLLVLFVIALAVFPVVMAIHGGDAGEIDKTEIKTLYLRNESGFEITEADIREDVLYAGVKLELTDADDKALAGLLAENKTAAAAVIALDQMKGFTVSGYYAGESDVTAADAAALAEMLGEKLRAAQMRTLGVTEAQTEMLRGKAFTTVTKVADFRSGSEQTDTATHAFVNIAYSYSIVLLISMAMAYIFQLCMEEKVSKLVEALLVSVKPSALLAGKTLAVTCFLFGGIGLILCGLFISYQIAKTMGDTAFIRDAVVKALEFDPAALHFSAGTLTLLIVCVLLAYAMGAAYSAIVGSCCSKTEDTQQASIAVVLFVMIGYFSASFSPMMESDSANIFLSVFPLTSIFIALPNYICGKIDLTVMLIALAVQALTVLFFVKLAGRVYRMMLLYRGGVPKPKQLLAMLREAGAAEKAAKGKEDANGTQS